MAISTSYLLCTQVNFFLVAANVFITHSALATSDLVKPSEYAYKDDSVARVESATANCRRYPVSSLPQGVHPDFIHCDGTQLKLADSTFGQEQYYTTMDYYVWDNINRNEELLFIFPTRVSLTTITLHYYSDSDQGRPSLRFYAVPEDFDVWDALTPGNPNEDVAAVRPGGEPAGRRSVSISVNFNTKKVLMFKFRSNFQFAVSEVEFFRCNTAPTTSGITNGSNTSTVTAGPTTTASGTTNDSTTSTVKGPTTKPKEEASESSQMTYSGSAESVSNSTNGPGAFDIANGKPVITVYIGIGVVTLIVLTAVVVVVLTLVLFYLRKSSHPKPKSDHDDDSYSTLCRGETQKLQPHSQQPPTDLYNQIQLSPSTGQSEMVSTTETENINILSSQRPSVFPNTDTDQYNKISEQDNVSTSEQPTYAAVKKKQKKSKHLKGKNFPKNASSLEKNKEEVVLHSAIKVKKRETTPTSVGTTESLEALYSVVQKKPKADRNKEEKVPLPPPPYSVEELYTAVRKNAKGSAMEEEDGAPQIPPHTIEDLYTAVMKKPKGDPTDTGTDGEPPIPPYTVDDF